MGPEDGVRSLATSDRNAAVDRLDSTISPENTLRDHHRQRLAMHLHSLGSRAVLEAMLELEAGRSMDAVLRDYRRLSPGLLRALGADRMPPMPLTVTTGRAA